MAHPVEEADVFTAMPSGLKKELKLMIARGMTAQQIEKSYALNDTPRPLLDIVSRGAAYLEDENAKVARSRVQQVLTLFPFLNTRL